MNGISGPFHNKFIVEQAGQPVRSTINLFFVEQAGQPVLEKGATRIQAKNLSKPAPAATCFLYFPDPALTSVQARSYNAVAFPTSCKNFILANTSAGG